jgi:hypothetical protein
VQWSSQTCIYHFLTGTLYRDHVQSFSQGDAKNFYTAWEAAVVRFVSEGVACLPKLRQGVFTTAAVDNVDHNPSSTTSKSSFHGTGI